MDTRKVGRIGAAAVALGLSLAGPQAGLAVADGRDDAVSANPAESGQASTAGPHSRAAAARSKPGPVRSRVSSRSVTARAAASADPGPQVAVGRIPRAVAVIAGPERGSAAAAEKPPASPVPEVEARRAQSAVVVAVPAAAAATPTVARIAPQAAATETSPNISRVAVAAAQGAVAKAVAPGQVITALQTRIAHFLDEISSWLTGLPSNPITEFAAGALLLVRRALFPTIPMIPAVTAGQTYGGYLLRDPENPAATGFSSEVIAAAQRIRAEAASAEPEITRDMIDLANAHGGAMQGLDFRLKSEQSLARKIADRTQTSGNDAWTEAQKLSDVTRYTMTFPTGIYAQSVSQTASDLTRQGYQLRVKNYWQQGDPYQGINVALTEPTGQKIELQFHTPESLAIKEGDLHKLYEIFRESTDNDERWRIYLEMAALAMTIPMPSYRVLEIDVLEFQPFEILQTAADPGQTPITLLAAA